MRIVFSGCVCLLIAAAPSGATPFFARSLGMTCAGCHSGFPRLNAFGLAFKANGFRIPGTEERPVLTWRKTIPLAVQVMPQVSRNSPGGAKTQFTDTELLAGGLLLNRTSAFLHYDWYIDAVPQPFPTWELWAQQVLDERSKLMLKFGQFELPYAYSPVINRTTVSLPLTLFGAALQRNDVAVGGLTSGVQLSGLIPGRVRWYLAGGAPSSQSTGNTIGSRSFVGRFRDLFARVATPDQAHQVGAFVQLAYPPRDPLDSGTRERDRRIGLDFSMIQGADQLQAMILYGENSDPTGSGHLGTMRGAFVEADRMLRPWIGITGRLDVLGLDTGLKRSFRDSLTLAVRAYPHKLVRLIAEYQRLDHSRSVVSLGASVVF